MAGPPTWIVAWGRPGRFDWRTVEVGAWDEDEARARARELHPELPPPPYAFLSGSPGPQEAPSDGR